LFDTPTPGYPKIAAAWKRYPRAAAGVLSDLVRGNRLKAFREAGEHIRMLIRIAAKKLPGETSGATPASDSQNIAPAIFHPAMMRAYRPRVLAAPILHLVGAAVHVSTKILSDPRLGWRDFAGAECELRSVAGDHVSIFAECHAPALAAELEAMLQKLHAPAAASA
jgi:thioesterase domain-containing protein